MEILSGLIDSAAVLCGETAALAMGLPTLRTPLCIDLATTLPGRSGVRRSSLMVLGDDAAAKQVRETRSYPLRYCLKKAVGPELQGEFRCTSPVQTTLDLMTGGKLSEALVVADGLARSLHGQGMLAPGSNLMSVRESPAAFHPFFSTYSVTIAVSSAGAISGGPSSGLWVSSMEKPSILTPGSGVISVPMKPYTGKSSAKTGIRGLGHGFARWGWSDVENPARRRHEG